MKHISKTSLTITLSLITWNASASHIYTNAISAHNIASIQHTIGQTVVTAFDNHTHNKHPINAPSSTTYGHAPMYGTMSMYGEYNDDGRSGGDTINARQTISNAWLNWQHIGNDTKFDEIPHLNSKHNLYTGGLTSEQTKIGNAHAAWGIYTGFLDGSTANNDINMKSHGGFFGIYNRYKNQQLNISTTVNSGAINNATDTKFGTDETTNFWLGGTIFTSYNIPLDNTFILRPNIQIGYTWIKSENYMSASGDNINNDAFSMFELTPGISAIKHIGNNWFGEINIKHVITFDSKGNITVNNAAIKSLTNHDFTEYSISLKKSIDKITFYANIGRRDGAHSGWIGGINFKYLF